MLFRSELGGNTAQEVEFCSGPSSTQPFRFCLADQKSERAKRQLTSALASARLAAANQKVEIARYVRSFGGVTLTGDPVRALDASQRAWERSYRADCHVVGLTVATGNAGTEGVTTNAMCEADRILERVSFLNDAFR